MQVLWRDSRDQRLLQGVNTNTAIKGRNSHDRVRAVAFPREESFARSTLLDMAGRRL